MSYDGGLYFGFTACHDRVPSVQRLAVYTGEALDELERVFAGAARRRGPAAARGKSAGKARKSTGASRSKKKTAKARAARTSRPASG
jgi:hypothetical protein